MACRFLSQSEGEVVSREWIELNPVCVSVHQLIRVWIRVFLSHLPHSFMPVRSAFSLSSGHRSLQDREEERD